MSKKTLFYLFIFLLIAAVVVAVFWKKQPQIITPPSNAEKAIIDRVTTAEFGDLTEIKQRRLLRVLVAYSKTNFFFDGPEIKGFDYEIMREYEKFLNEKVKNESDKVVITFIVKPFAEILDALVDGKGDIAVANFTVTPEREKLVQFTKPYISSVNEVLVHNKSMTDVDSFESLSGKSVYLLSGSSFIEHLENINVELEEKQLPQINIIEADTNLSSEDIFELINVNVYSATVADDFTAKTWQSVLPNIVVQDNLHINSGGEIAWAVRKNSHELLNSLNEFINTVKKGSLLGNIFFKRYYENSKWIENPTNLGGVTRLEKYKSTLIKYASEYNFDWLSVAALAFQESRLDQSKVSSKGAIGIMQILPNTATSAEVDISDISNVENNINAGVKYLAYLRKNFFTSEDIAPGDQIDFTWAAYNAGPGRISQLRQLAAEQGYDPNKWFSNVERIAAQELGRETVQYVANINKYYIAYKLAEENL